jgi:hypothetical protein
MLAVNRPLLKRGYSLMNVQKALAWILSMCNLHVIFLSEIIPKHFYIIYKWDVSSVLYKERLGRWALMEEVDRPNLVFI